MRLFKGNLHYNSVNHALVGALVETALKFRQNKRTQFNYVPTNQQFLFFEYVLNTTRNHEQKNLPFNKGLIIISV